MVFEHSCWRAAKRQSGLKLDFTCTSSVFLPPIKKKSTTIFAKFGEERMSLELHLLKYD